MKRTYFFDFDGTLVDCRETTKTELPDAQASVTDPIERRAALRPCQVCTQGVSK